MKKTVEKKTISDEAALRVVQAALAKAREFGRPKAVAVLDDGGNLKAFCRMDGTPLLSIEMAQQKAYTALNGQRSEDFYGHMKALGKEDPGILMAGLHIPRMTYFAGGAPIVVDGAVVGAVGCSGGPLDQDAACARAGAEALN